MKTFFLIIFATVWAISPITAQNTFTTKKGHASFFSSASIADVDAHNEKVDASLNTVTNNVVFDMRMSDFQFRSRKMGRDAEKKYLETEKFTIAGFDGKIIGKIDYDKPGTYPATATGKLKIHGVEKEVTEKGSVTVAKGVIILKAEFPVELKDYDIETPQILGQKMTKENVLVKVEVALLPSPDK